MLLYILICVIWNLLKMIKITIFRWPRRNTIAWRSGRPNFCLYNRYSISKSKKMWQILVRRRKSLDKIHRISTGWDSKSHLVKGHVRELWPNTICSKRNVWYPRPLFESTSSMWCLTRNQFRILERKNILLSSGYQYR